MAGIRKVVIMEVMKMSRHMFIVILVLLLVADKHSCADDAVPDAAIQAAFSALRDNPGNSASFEALVRATAASETTPEQARALAICYLGYLLSGKSSHAKNVKALLDANHASSVYQEHVRDELLFNQAICPDCKGSATAETPCAKCSSGKCTNCKGEGEKPGMSSKSKLTCSSCKGTGACRFCNGAGSLGTKCPSCRGVGAFTEFKREETQEIYRLLLQKPLHGESKEAVNTLPILEESVIREFCETYDAATSLNKHTVYQAFLRQIGCNDTTPPLLFMQVPDGLQFVVKDVSIGKDKDVDQHYYVMLASKNYPRCKLIIPEGDKAFADGLKKDTVLTSRGWLKPLKGLPPWGKSRDTFYRSVNDYQLLQ